MTDINDLYEPGDDREPVDLKQARAAYEQVLRERHTPAVSRVLSALAMAIEELQGARERIAEFEALPTREEWVVTEKHPFTPDDPGAHQFRDGGGALRVAKRLDGQAWRRRLTVHPWEPIANEPPF